MLPNPASLIYHKSKICSLSGTLLHLEVEPSRPSTLHPLFPHSRPSSTVVHPTGSSHLRAAGLTPDAVRQCIYLCPTPPYPPPPTPSVSSMSPSRLAGRDQPRMLAGFLCPGCLDLVTASLCPLFLFPVFLCLMKALRLSPVESPLVSYFRPAELDHLVCPLHRTLLLTSSFVNLLRLVTSETPVPQETQEFPLQCPCGSFYPNRFASEHVWS